MSILTKRKPYDPAEIVYGVVDGENAPIVIEIRNGNFLLHYGDNFTEIVGGKGGTLSPGTSGGGGGDGGGSGSKSYKLILEGDKISLVNERGERESSVSLGNYATKNFVSSAVVGASFNTVTRNLTLTSMAGDSVTVYVPNGIDHDTTYDVSGKDDVLSFTETAHEDGKESGKKTKNMKFSFEGEEKSYTVHGFSQKNEDGIVFMEEDIPVKVDSIPTGKIKITQ